jgi:hypothetical protein
LAADRFLSQNPYAPAMGLSIFILIKSLVVIFVIYKLGWFAKNYYHARRSGLPAHVIPAFTKSTVWLVLAPSCSLIWRNISRA